MLAFILWKPQGVFAMRAFFVDVSFAIPPFALGKTNL
jgi:hypothetical protein